MNKLWDNPTSLVSYLSRMMIFRMLTKEIDIGAPLFDSKDISNIEEIKIKNEFSYVLPFPQSGGHISLAKLVCEYCVSIEDEIIQPLIWNEETYETHGFVSNQFLKFARTYIPRHNYSKNPDVIFSTEDSIYNVETCCLYSRFHFLNQHTLSVFKKNNQYLFCECVDDSNYLIGSFENLSQENEDDVFHMIKLFMIHGHYIKTIENVEMFDGFHSILTKFLDE